jgi:catechol 2,3-dioxygenase-like lactoylglutathione lyase family enzyme
VLASAESVPLSIERVDVRFTDEGRTLWTWRRSWSFKPGDSCAARTIAGARHRTTELTTREKSAMAITLKQATEERTRLIDHFIKGSAKKYGGFESAAGGVNHIAFLTDKLEETIEFYTQVIRLKLLRVRVDDGDARSTQVFFDMGRGELLAFLKVYNVTKANRMGLGGFHHYALTVDGRQYTAVKKRLDERKIPYTTIKHEILTTMTTHDPNGIVLELSKWNIDPKNVRM